MTRAGRNATALVLASLSLCTGSCADRPRPRAERYEHEELAAEVLEEREPPDPEDAPPAFSVRAGVASSDERDARPPPVWPASHGDGAYDGEEPVVARRYVYRVRMAVPSWLGSGEERITPSAAELFVDVSHERLRARFTGNGWPVPAGAEVRLRRDRPGVYLFDSRGGRALGPGELAGWFEGGAVGRRGPPLRVYASWGFPRHHQAPDDEVHPGQLVCALLAELAAEPREAVLRRCDLGAPHLWRLGFWRAEQTAGVPIELSRSALRADEASPPRPIRHESSRAFLEPEALARVEANRTENGDPSPDAPAEGLRVRNDSATRAVVSLQGMPLGFVDAGEEAWFVGIRPGSYDIGTVRPLGAVLQRGRAIAVPGVHRICDGPCAAGGMEVETETGSGVDGR